MLVECPLCGCFNPVVADYEPGSTLACKCGSYLEFQGEGRPGIPVQGPSPKYFSSRPPPPSDPGRTN
jgi:hypothetical protein